VTKLTDTPSTSDENQKVLAAGERLQQKQTNFDYNDLGNARPIRRCPECGYYERGRRVIKTERKKFRVTTSVISEIVWSGRYCPVDGNPLEEKCKCNAYLISPTDACCRVCGNAFWWLAQTGQVDIGMSTWQVAENELETIGEIRLYAVQGSLTKVEADAIVSSDDVNGLMNSRSARAIRRDGGIEIEAESTAYPRHAGEAWVTKGGKLHVRRIIHVAVLKPNSSTDALLVERSLRNALRLANEEGLRNMALPPLGTGRSNFPLDESIRISRQAVSELPKTNGSLESIAFVLFTPEQFNGFRAAYRAAIADDPSGRGVGVR